MVAYANAEAMAATLATGEVHFFSRSRGRLWRKGESSGNVLRLRGLALDCDGDAVLATVQPAGPACHRNTRSCFDPDGCHGPDAACRRSRGRPDRRRRGPPASPQDRPLPARASPGSRISGRRSRAGPRSRPVGSYTAQLLAAGVDGPARKVTEEATEVLMAAKDDAVAEAAGSDRTALRRALAGEAADLLYHALVLLAERGLPPSAVIDRLRERHRG